MHKFLHRPVGALVSRRALRRRSATGATNGRDPYDLMEALAAQTPAGANGVIPIFSDAMDFSRWYHAAPSFLNLSLDPARCNKGVLFRALQENAAIVAAVNLERVREFADANATSPLVFAGGASKGKLWPQIVADVTGREIRIPVVREATSLGGAAAAGVGIGLLPRSRRSRWRDGPLGAQRRTQPRQSRNLRRRQSALADRLRCAEDTGGQGRHDGDVERAGSAVRSVERSALNGNHGAVIASEARQSRRS